MAAVVSFLQRQVSMIRHLKLQPISSRWFTTQTQGKLACRLAKSGDYHDIVKLSDGVFGEYDYIPVVFHDWLKMDNKFIMLLHAGTKLIGLEACTIVDDGKTIFRGAWRILPDFRGQGLIRNIVQATDEHVRANFPKICRERGNSFFPLDTMLVNPWQKILEKDVLAFYVEEKPFRVEKLHAVNELEIESCAKEYFSNVILSPSAIEKLFPNNVLVFDWRPFEPLRSNVDLILRENELHFFVEKGAVDKWPRSFSHGVYAQRVKTVEWQATAYTDDPTTFEAHILHQFKRACEAIDGKFTFFTFQDQSMTECVKRVLRDTLQLKQVRCDSNETMKLFERDFICQYINVGLSCK